ncbi:MAG: hypothetical protein ACI3YH_02815 [Eubacteriales bacterium]
MEAVAKIEGAMRLKIFAGTATGQTNPTPATKVLKAQALELIFSSSLFTENAFRALEDISMI